MFPDQCRFFSDFAEAAATSEVHLAKTDIAAINQERSSHARITSSARRAVRASCQTVDHARIRQHHLACINAQDAPSMRSADDHSIANKLQVGPDHRQGVFQPNRCH